jgi:ribosomal protein S18 acetylase RimI-like enzyme
MESPITTREFRIDDYEAAVELWRVVEGVEIAEGDDKNSIASFLQRNPEWSRVAIIDGKIVGVALCGHDGRRGHIYHLAVDPAYQRRGLGKLLVEECLSGLRAVGIQRVIILVAGDNAYGLSFWRRAGWEKVDGAVVMGIDL